MCLHIQRTLPYTTECSPKTITLPGAETIKGGAMGADALRCDRVRWCPLPLTGDTLPLDSAPSAIWTALETLNGSSAGVGRCNVMTISSCYLTVRAGVLEARGAEVASEKIVVVVGARGSKYANAELLYASINVKRGVKRRTARDCLAAEWVMQRLCRAQLLETWKYKAAC